MKKSNSNSKALSAFKKLGAVALITATLAMCFTACNQTGGTGGGGGKPTPTPKHAITFGVEGSAPNGTLTAKVEIVYNKVRNLEDKKGKRKPKMFFETTTLRR